jgi:hypothetical protein
MRAVGRVAVESAVGEQDEGVGKVGLENRNEGGGLGGGSRGRRREEEEEEERCEPTEGCGEGQGSLPC